MITRIQFKKDTIITRIQFFETMLWQGNWRQTLSSLQALVAVATGEEGAYPDSGDWNPINTILYKPGATPLNSFGPNGRYHVWNYPNENEGIQACVETIKGWPMVDAALTNQASALTIVRLYDESDGVGGHLYEDVLPLVQSTWPKYGNIQVPGQGPIINPTEKGIPPMIIFQYPTGVYYSTSGAQATHIATKEDLDNLVAAGVPVVELSASQAENYLKGLVGPV